MGFLKILCIFVLCVECNRRYSYFHRIGRLSGVRYSGRHRERLCASGLPSSELSAQVGRPNSCISCKPAHMDASITRTGRNSCVYVENGRGRRPRAFVVWMWTKACFSRPNSFSSRRTKPPSSRKCKQHRMWELGRHDRWNYPKKPSYNGKIVAYLIVVESLCVATVILFERLDWKTPCLMHTLVNQ